MFPLHYRTLHIDMRKEVQLHTPDGNLDYSQPEREAINTDVNSIENSIDGSEKADIILNECTEKLSAAARSGSKPALEMEKKPSRYVGGGRAD